MKHKAFTQIVASSCRIPQKTVALFVRHLKEAGLLTTGARGVNAPEMTTRDMARMVVALLATDRPNEAVAMVRRYGKAEYRSQASEQYHDENILNLKDGHHFVDVLTGIFSADGLDFLALSPYVAIRPNGFTASIEIGSGRAIFSANQTDGEMQEARQSLLGIRVERGLAGHELSELMLPFFLERRDGSTWEEMVETDRAASLASKHILGGGKII